MDPYGLPLALLIEAAGVSVDTARRWKRIGRIPAVAAQLVRLRTEGDLGVLDPAWSGFTLRRGQLWTPYQFSVSPGEISAIPYRFAQLSALERELRTPRQWDLFGDDRPALVDVVSHFAIEDAERRRRSPSSARAWWRRR